MNTIHNCRWFVMISHALVLFTGCSIDAHSDRNLLIGGHEFVIPKEYVISNMATLLAPDPGDLEAQSETLIKIPLIDFDQKVSGELEEEETSNLIVRLAVVDVGGDLYPKDVEDAWRGEGLYVKRVVERDIEVGLVRVYPKSGYPVLWNYFKQNPEDQPLVESIGALWVANCRLSPGTDTFSAKRANCVNRFLWENLSVELAFPGYMVDRVDELKFALRQRLSEWHVDGKN